MSTTNVIDLQDNRKSKDYDKRRNALHQALGFTAPDYSRGKMNFMPAPQQDNAAIQENKNLARTAMIAQGIEALANTAGVIGTAGSSNQFQPSQSNVGANLGMQAYGNLANLDQGYRERLGDWQSNVFDTQKHNRQMDVKQAEAESSLSRDMIKQQLQTLRNEYEQDNLTEREYERQRGLWKRAALNNGYQWDERTNTLTAMEDGPGSDREDDRFRPTGRQRQLYEQYKRYMEKAGEADLLGGDAVRGSDAWHAERLMDQMGDDFYLIDHALGNTDESRGTRTGGYDTQNRNLVERMEFQPFRGEAEQATAMSQMNTTAQKIRQGAATPQDVEAWQQNYMRTAASMGIKDPQTINQKMGEALQAMLQGQQPEQTPGDQQAPQDPMAGGVPGLPGQQAGMVGGGNVVPEGEHPIGGNRSGKEQAKPQPNRRESLPRHLRQTYDLGDKLIEQMRRMEQIQGQNANVNTTAGDRQVQRLRQQLIDRLNRLPENQRQSVIDALEYNPFEDQN